MMKLHLAAAALLFMAVAPRAEEPPGDVPEDVSYRLKRIRKNHKVPALAVAATVDGDVVALGAQGRRRITEKVERVMKDKGFEPLYDSKDKRYIAIVKLHGKRDAIMVIHVDDSGRVTNIEIRTRMWM